MADTNDADRATIARLADEVLPMLIERLAASDMGELEVRQDGWRVRLRRPFDELLTNGQAAPAAPAGRAVPATGRTGAGHATEASQPRREVPRGLVTSPGVGYFSVRDGVVPGSSVRAGDVIGVVDVLGVRHEVVSAHDGVLRSLEVETGQAVEYGQTIGRVDV